MTDLVPVTVAISDADRAAAAVVAVEQADAALGRAVFCDRLAMGAVATLLNWLGESATVAPANAALDGWLGRSQVDVVDLGCLVCATLGPEVIDGDLPDRWTLPLNLPQNCLGVVPVAIARDLGTAYLWGYQPLLPTAQGDSLPETIALTSLHEFEQLAQHLDAVRDGLALLDRDDDLGPRLRSCLAPQALAIAIASLESLYRDGVRSGMPPAVGRWGEIAGEMLVRTARVWSSPAEPTGGLVAEMGAMDAPVRGRVREGEGAYEVRSLSQDSRDRADAPDPGSDPDAINIADPGGAIASLVELGQALAERLMDAWQRSDV